MKKIILEDGKYTILVPEQREDYFRCLRCGEKWRDLTGDNLVLSLCYEIFRLQDLLQENKSEAQCAEIFRLQEETEKQKPVVQILAPASVEIHVEQPDEI